MFVVLVLFVQKPHRNYLYDLYTEFILYYSYDEGIK